eukprot:CAMPEP_0172744844 /NCGR_PEP_ID=MMETSP1074-20121228/136326_1 /TAXON_ID=2916 /ORGANISM="Ceratium fusus, Strain PA161109" /LENGTH=121 /DNA_ID=CAMNT_0013575877 /DNA_START=44 /DNA_END=409 /DNA_ORIENTATION=-
MMETVIVLLVTFGHNLWNHSKNLIAQTCSRVTPKGKFRGVSFSFSCCFCCCCGCNSCRLLAVIAVSEWDLLSDDFLANPSDHRPEASATGGSQSETRDEVILLALLFFGDGDRRALGGSSA